MTTTGGLVVMVMRPDLSGFELPAQGSLNGAGGSSELNVNSLTQLEMLDSYCTLLFC